MNLLNMIISAVIWSLLHIPTILGQTTGYCPGGSISYPQQSTSSPSPPTDPLQLFSKSGRRKPTGAALVLGLTNPILSAANFKPTAILTSPPQSPKQPSTALEAGRPTAATANLDLSLPSPPQCNYSCYDDSYCQKDEKCCINGCQQICRKAVQLTNPPTTCAAVKCTRGAQCLNLESGAICDRPVHNGTCPDPQNFYGGSFAGCASDSACDSNEKCCRSQDSGFVCTPVSRLFPLTCNDVYCAGNKACTINDATGLPQCVPNKRGQCPYYDVLYGPLRSNNGECRKQCSVDVDCRGNLKCCQIGCDQVCVAPDLSYTCACKQCSRPFRCEEEEYGYGRCVSVTKKAGTCPSTPFIIDFDIARPCIGNDKPGECGVDGDCRGNQKCCRPDYCQPSMCTPPETSCDNIYCNYDEMCQNSTGIAMCVKGLCPPPPSVTSICPVSTSLLESARCRSNADCPSNPTCPNRVCCAGVCGGRTCRKSGIYCGYVNGTIQVCPSGNLCLNPLYPAIPDYTCYDPNPGQHQIAGCF